MYNLQVNTSGIMPSLTVLGRVDEAHSLAFSEIGH